MKTLGIIGGMSPESTVIYYQEINRLVNQKAGGNHSAPMVMLSVDFEEIVRRQKSGAWQETGEILAEAAVKLESIGAQGILLATNIEQHRRLDCHFFVLHYLCRLGHLCVEQHCITR